MQGKVEICGVNTARLPRLDSRETEALLRRVIRTERVSDFWGENGQKPADELFAPDW